MSFIIKEKNGVPYFQDEKISLMNGISHIFTTRKGGFSKGPLKSMNMSVSRDERNVVLKNYKAVCSCENIPYDRCVLAHQTHTNNVKIVTEADAGKGLIIPSDIKDTDGLITNTKNLPLVIFYADCVPVLLFDYNKKVVAAVHAGWRGTVKNICGNAIKIMCENFGTNPKDIYAAIGPSIGKCCFETGEETLCEFKNSELQAFVFERFIDLQSSNKHLLEKSGVLAENISISEKCTKCNTDLFFSHRGCGADTGRMALIACLK